MGRTTSLKTGFRKQPAACLNGARPVPQPRERTGRVQELVSTSGLQGTSHSHPPTRRDGCCVPSGETGARAGRDVQQCHL